MPRARTLLIFLLGLLGMVGCNTYSGQTNLLNPGTAAEQRRRAERFDPYPENDIGPEVVGGRPRDYPEPVSQPERARWTTP